MHKLKAIVRRGGLLAAAAVVAAATYLPAIPFAAADALNPLTDRSLTLSSSAPGWDYTDGSGNTTYAQPNSGANGQKTGNTFSFKVSSSATVKGMTFQYCTESAGDCTAPGDNGWTGTDPSATRNVDTTTTSDLKVVFPSPDEVDTADFSTVVDSGTANGTGTITTTTTDGEVVGAGTQFNSELVPGDTITTAGSNTYTVSAIADDTHLTLSTTPSAAEAGVAFTYPSAKAGQVIAVPGFKDPSNPSSTDGQFAASGTAGNFVVFYNDNGTWTQSSGWTLTAGNLETGTVGAATGTGQNNYITLANATGTAFTAGQQVKVVFFGTNDNYIQNPGSGAFFVKINTYSSDSSMIGDHNDSTPADKTDHTVIDGGVTVANVMNHSISIQTRVLETMDFSVGTVDPFTLDSTGGLTSEYGLAFGGENGTHRACDRILTGMLPSDPVNVLELGKQSAESSLSTDVTYSTHSYWRLSSNSSAGATVYYSGVTLSNTVGDEIEPIGPTKKAPSTNSEQFGLALANTAVGTDPNMAVDYTVERGQPEPKGDYENGVDNSTSGVHASVATDLSGATYHNPQLYPLAPTTNYSDGAGTVNTNYSSGSSPIDTMFAFDESSNSIPVPIAVGTQVVDCVTGKMRYVANIAATTPAGIYTTKINYIAAPQY